MDSCDGSAWRARVTASDGVVEDGHLVCTRDVLQQYLLDFRVEYLLDVLVVCEVLFFGADVVDDLKSVLIEVVFGLVASDVVHCYFDLGAAEVPLWLTLRWFLDIVVWFATVFGFAEEV